MPSLLANQLTISLTGQGSKAKQNGADSSHPSGFISQIQSTALQDQTYAASDSHEILTNRADQKKTDITVLERKISQLKIKYRQK